MKKILTLIALAFAIALPALAQDTKPKINKKNLVIKEWNTDPRSGKKVLDHVTTYSPDGKKIEEIEYGSGGQKWRKRFEYAPGTDGKCIKESVYDERNRLNTVKKYEYNVREAVRSTGWWVKKSPPSDSTIAVSAVLTAFS